MTDDGERACFPRDLLDNRDDLSTSSNEDTANTRRGEDGRGVCVCLCVSMCVGTYMCMRYSVCVCSMSLCVHDWERICGQPII